jgi:hypothetical protein
MSISGVAAAFVAGQQQQTQGQIAIAIARQNVEAQRAFASQIAELAREFQAAAPPGTGRVVDRSA